MDWQQRRRPLAVGMPMQSAIGGALRPFPPNTVLASLFRSLVAVWVVFVVVVVVVSL